jgi:hypothetical protein
MPVQVENEVTMETLLRAVWALTRKAKPDERSIRPRVISSLDRLPPVLGPSDWSDGVLQMMAESSAAWYFDRR